MFEERKREVTVTKEQLVDYLWSCIRRVDAFSEEARPEKNPDEVAECEETVRQFAAAILIADRYGLGRVEYEE